MTALIFSFKKYAKDHGVIVAGPTNSSDTSMSTSVTDTTTKLSKSVAPTPLNTSIVIPIKNSDKELEKSYRGGSGSAQNSMSNLPVKDVARSKSGNKKSSKKNEIDKATPEENIKKTNPIRIDQIQRSNTSKLPTPNLPRDIVDEIRDQLDETQVRLVYIINPPIMYFRPCAPIQINFIRYRD